MTSQEFSYSEYIEEKLAPHPVGRTTDELVNGLPQTADEAELERELETLATNGTVKRIGDTWRWMDF